MFCERDTRHPSQFLRGEGHLLAEGNAAPSLQWADLATLAEVTTCIGMFCLKLSTKSRRSFHDFRRRSCRWLTLWILCPGSFYISWDCCTASWRSSWWPTSSCAGTVLYCIALYCNVLCHVQHRLHHLRHQEGPRGLQGRGHGGGGGPSVGRHSR